MAGARLKLFHAACLLLHGLDNHAGLSIGPAGTLTMLGSMVQNGKFSAAATAAPNVGALIIRIGFGGVLYHFCSKEPPKPYFNY